ncbi:membrane protein [Lysobacter helvus]|uniref:Membrane protein n=2 Tax=Lysobacteraceae TaxID=32033 RepID=A0ABM7Q4M7_9GAMM|nr:MULTISPECIES: stage II sporulation protein M [Lysobacter]BCT92145.1 membrane protein [Lysobacter caseinilyticus]BCT95298.1 membrane protein [Lysobacter helvus]
MRQAQFIARHAAEWDALEAWLDKRAGHPGRARADATWQGLSDADMPARYRRVCQHLGLARRRGYSPAVVDRLQVLMERGHTALYRPPPLPWRRALRFFLADFPRLVRADPVCLWLSTALFVVPAVAMYIAVTWHPELVHTLLSPMEVAQFERMYDPGNVDVGRTSGTDVAMFGLYIFNNISIAFRTFAAGLLAGVGTAFVLLFNGVYGGAVAGHLHGVGFDGPLWRFVVGHSAFELTGVVIAGAAGLRLGVDLLAPGQRRRVDALIEAGRRGALLSVGVLGMLLVAAFVEAFWSSIGTRDPIITFTVGAVLWTGVLTWLARGGKGATDAP